MISKIILMVIVLLSFAYCQDNEYFDNLRENELTEDLFNDEINDWINNNFLSRYSHLQENSETNPLLNSSDIIGDFTNIINTIIDQLNLTNITIAGDGDKCVIDFLRLVLNFKKEWALQMLDATGKIPSGILRGNKHWMGRYYQCKSISVPSENNSYFGDFKGEYCSVSWNIKFTSELKMPITVGICVPDSCHSVDFINDTNIVRNFINEIPVVKRINQLVNISGITCSNDENRTLDAGAKVYIVILGIFIILLVAGTICDIYAKLAYEKIPTADKMIAIEQGENTSVNSMYGTLVNRDGNDKSFWFKEQMPKSRHTLEQIEKFLICFSVYTNGAKLLNVESSTGQLESLHGIRFLSMSWVILGHTYLTTANSMDNMLDVLTETKEFSFQLILQATFSVDSFFVLSGFLLTYLFLNECKKREGKINWIYYYVHRIWRLTPTLALIMGLYATLWIYLGSGPLWPNEPENGNCKTNWWWNLLYIQNFIKNQDMCMSWTWYLANDMQFYVISPLILIFLWKLPIVGLINTGILLLASWITICILVVVNKLFLVVEVNTDHSDSLIKILEDLQKQMDFFDMVYDKPYTRIGSYLIGILLGYILYNTQRRKILKLWMLIAGWIIATSLAISVVFGLYHVRVTNATATAYNIFSRTTWSIALGWVIYVCSTGQGGIVNSILSWKVWIPFSRLTYCAYLIHPMILSWYFNSMEVLFHYQKITIVTQYFGFLLFSYIIAFVASVAFESPMMAIEKFFLQRKSDS